MSNKKYKLSSEIKSLLEKQFSEKDYDINLNDYSDILIKKMSASETGEAKTHQTHLAITGESQQCSQFY